MPEFWQTSGYRLLRPTDSGLAVTAEFLRAYYTRPEVAPVEESCPAELALFNELIDDPMLDVPEARIAGIADPDARENYAAVLAFRDHLLAHPTLEAAYLALMRSGAVNIAPIFVDQLVHVILRAILDETADPMRARAAEVFFREQTVSTENGLIMLADEETVEMYAATGGLGGLGQLLVESGAAARSVELDVLDDDNKDIYWARSDRFDTVIDFRFTQPALDAFARVMEAWITHFLQVRTRIQPRQRITDDKWTWHVGLDAEASRILNGLYEGQPMTEQDLDQIIALFELQILDREAVMPQLRGKPVYLALARTRHGKLRMKPQNLLVNLPMSPDT